MMNIEWNPLEFQFNGFDFPNAALATTPTSLRIDFEDSLNCGGTNGNQQIFTGSGTFSNISEVTFEYAGRVERNSAIHDRFDLYVNSSVAPWAGANYLVYSTASFGDDLGCQMSDVPRFDTLGSVFNNTPGDIISHNPENRTVTIKGLGKHSTITVFATTGDGEFHVGAYLAFTVVDSKPLKRWSLGRLRF